MWKIIFDFLEVGINCLGLNKLRFMEILHEINLYNLIIGNLIIEYF